MPDITSIPAPRVPFIDERTGLISREWYRFMLNLFALTGSGTSDLTITDLAIAPNPVDPFTTLGSALEQAQLASLTAQYSQFLDIVGVAPTAQQTVPPDDLRPVQVQDALIDNPLTIGDTLTLPKASGKGIKVDKVSPTFGWRDLTADIQVRGSGPNDPSFATYTGTTLRAYQFSASTMNEVFFVFHIPHDFVPGTDIYFHAHWSNATAVPNTGNVIWSFDYTFAKGFGQEAFPAVSTVSVTAACPATRYTHNISETAAVTIATMEVDGLILVRGYRDAAAVGDTCTDAVFLHTMDIHYQSSNIGTKQKAPDFYT